jgi:hypothetical protein
MNYVQNIDSETLIATGVVVVIYILIYVYRKLAKGFKEVIDLMEKEHGEKTNK